MMKQVVIVPDVTDKTTWTQHEVEDVRALLMDHFEVFPETARIYHQFVSMDHDITPNCEEDVDRLETFPGPFYVVVYPGYGADWLIYVIIAIMVISTILMIALMPAPPTPTERNIDDSSSNNELSQRTNKARIGGRVPDIFGTVRSVPDLISLPYKIYENHQQVEYCYMCASRGSLDILKKEDSLAYDVKDDTTLISDIGSASVEFYAPYTSPNSGDDPQLRIGDPIDTPVLIAKRFTSVNGQVLRPPNDEKVQGDSNIYFQYPNQIHLVKSSDEDFTDYFVAGDLFYISGAYEYASYVTVEYEGLSLKPGGIINFGSLPGGVPASIVAGNPIELKGAIWKVWYGPPDTQIEIDQYDLSGRYKIDKILGNDVYLLDYERISPDWEDVTSELTPIDMEITTPDGAKVFDLDGQYTVLSVDTKEIILEDPSSDNADWLLLDAMVGDKTANLSPILSTFGPKWVGPFTLDVDDMTKVFSNFVALNGLYKDNGKKQVKARVKLRMEVTPVNAAGEPIEDVENFDVWIYGSATTRSQRAETLKASLAIPGPCKVRARRISKTDENFNGQIVDEVKWQDVYAISPVGKSHFGNVTTIQTRTYATSGALAVKERKFNFLGTRLVPIRGTDGVFTTELMPTNSAADILSFVCQDTKIGRRTADEMDFDNIYDTVAQVVEYFGHAKAGEFNYTFDKTNLSFEETVGLIADAVFCTAYRQGMVLRLFFEKATEDSTLLFNHRNKHPGSETRNVHFGNQGDFDGVEYEYVDSKDDAIVTYYLPTDQSAVNPKKIESVGIRSKIQAYWHAWRTWNKIRHQHEETEFDALQEAELLVRGERVLVSDNTRTAQQEGEVVSQDVLELTLSQKVTMTDGVSYVIFLQLPDKTVESIPITAGDSDRKVILSRPPRLALALDDDISFRAIYMIVGDDEPRGKAFIITEKTPSGDFQQIGLKAINYDSRYYDNDTDYIDGIIDVEGELI